MASSLKEKTVAGVVWSSIERFSVQGIQFISQIFLARLLSPADYGLLAMLAIFVAVSQTFIDSGFTNALIQKKDRSGVDYSTVFFFNLMIGVVAYALLYICSPAIAEFYKTPELISITRVYMLSLPLGACGAIQRVNFTICLDFKSPAKAALLSVLCSGVLGIYLAFKGFGVWSLIASGLVNTLINTLLLWMISKWRPRQGFSIQSLKRMFSFGSQLLLSGLLDTIYKNLYQMIIGKVFSKEDLGFYSRADQLAQFPSSNITGIIARVTYPVLCGLAAEEERLRSTFRRFLKMTAFVVFPLMLYLAAVAKPFISVVFGEKWLPSAPLLQIICIPYMWYPLHYLNLNMLLVKGKPELAFKLEIYKKLVGVFIIATLLRFGLVTMLLGSILTSFIGLFINTYYLKKLLNYGLWQQLKDLLPIIIMALLSYLGAVSVIRLFASSVFSLVLSFFASIGLYLGVACLSKTEELNEMIILGKQVLSVKRK